MVHRYLRAARIPAIGCVLAVALVGGCAPADEVDARPLTSSATPDQTEPTRAVEPECEEEQSTLPAPVAQPPTWVGVRWLANQDGYEVVRSDGTQSTPVFRLEFQGAPYPSLPEDVAIDPTTGTVLFTICCEASGTVLAVDDPDHELSDQGRRVDLLAGGSLMVRADMAGGIGIRPDFPEWANETVLDRAHAVDVVVTPDARVVALIDSARVIDVGGAARPGVLVLDQEADCDWAAHHIAVDAGAYCSVVALDQGRIGLLAAAAGWHAASDEPCPGDTLDALHLSTGEVERGVLTFPASLAHLSSDGSGRYLIGTGVDGRVWWRTLDGTGGQLPGTSYVAADW